MKRAIIMGAAGRDYHNFLAYFKGNRNYKIIAFTQAQIPGIEKRKFPKKLAGKAYRESIPFYPEQKLSDLIKKYKIDEVFLCYSDLSHDEVMQKASLVLSTGASFGLLGPKETMLQSKASYSCLRSANWSWKISAVYKNYGNIKEKEMQDSGSKTSNALWKLK